MYSSNIKKTLPDFLWAIIIIRSKKKRTNNIKHRTLNPSWIWDPFEPCKDCGVVVDVVAVVVIYSFLFGNPLKFTIFYESVKKATSYILNIFIDSDFDFAIKNSIQK